MSERFGKAEQWYTRAVRVNVDGRAEWDAVRNDGSQTVRFATEAAARTFCQWKYWGCPTESAVKLATM